jgi:hypothetical protein
MCIVNRIKSSSVPLNYDYNLVEKQNSMGQFSTLSIVKPSVKFENQLSDFVKSRLEIQSQAKSLTFFPLSIEDIESFLHP